ncbi:MAG: hypothetical protein E6G10_21375 [Actinobacteria bacterium]|nr:MAG: hypothetical protein E6G10_21375 [Actinomycetota bacterium]
MRKILTTLLVLVALGAAAQSAMADDPGAYSSDSSGDNMIGRQCETPFRDGVPGQYGAWGNYVDGCTVVLECPAGRTCVAEAQGWMQTNTWDDDGVGDRVTMNSRLSVHDDSGMIWRHDVSCEGAELCIAPDTTTLTGGQRAQVQCNGVRESVAGHTAQATCVLRLKLS